MKPSVITTLFYSASGWSNPRREFVVFVFFGTVNTLLTYGIYLLLVLFIAYPVAYSVSYVSGVFISYYLNALFVFKENFLLSDGLQFCIFCFVRYLFGLVSFYMLIELF